MTAQEKAEIIALIERAETANRILRAIIDELGKSHQAMLDGLQQLREAIREREIVQ
jgi:hypothetical protein